jgi:RecB family exonuclease
LENPGIISSVMDRYKTLGQEELQVIDEMTGKIYEKVLGVAISIS